MACAICRAKDITVTGPHSHVCKCCGSEASYGWYAPTPLCVKCHDKLGPLSHWEPLPEGLVNEN